MDSSVGLQTVVYGNEWLWIVMNNQGSIEKFDL